MRVYKETPFEFGLMPWEIEPPRLDFLVFLKGTFSLCPGECPVAEKQATIHGEVPFSDSDNPSVEHDSDFALVKSRGEWLLLGSAYAPGGRPVTLLPVSVRVGALEKRFVVHGDRQWERGLLDVKPSAALPFVEMPLRWERSFGGPGHPDNPSGCGTSAVLGVDGRVEPVPNIEHPQHPIVSKDDRPPPAGAFPIPSTWRTRTRLLGTFDEAWVRERWPYFPRDFDPRFYQAAPADQQLREGYWRGDELIVLRGLSPAHPVLETRLPGLRARAFVEWSTSTGSAPVEVHEGVPRPQLAEIGLVLDTIRIDSRAGHVCCVWRGLLRGVADPTMSNVARLFFLHEPLAEDRPRPFYEEWLWRLLREEHAEGEAMEGASPSAEPPPAAPEPPAIAEVEALRSAITSSTLGAYAALGALLDAEEQLFRQPTAAEARASFEEAGVEPPEDLVDPEPPPPVIPEEDLPRSYKRLVAIVRHKLGRHFEGVDLTEAPFDGLDLRGASFRGAILTRAELRRARLDGAGFEEATLFAAKLTEASLTGARFDEAELAEVELERADLRGASMAGASAPDARFAQANLESVNGTAWSAEGSSFFQARLVGALLAHADLSRCSLDEADLLMANLEHTNLSGASAQRARFERCVAPDLRASEGVNLTDSHFVLVHAPNAQLQEVIALRTNFSGSDFTGADFSDGKLLQANFVRCAMRGAKLTRADLRMAQLLVADLMEADLEQADLREADLRGAHLFSANLWRTVVVGALLDGAELGRTHLEGR